MKNTLFIIILLFSFPFCSIGQVSAIGLTGGYVDDGFGLLAQYNHFLGRDSNSKLHAEFFYGKGWTKVGGISVPYDDSIVYIGYHQVVLRERRNKTYYASVGGGGLIGREVINNGAEQITSGSFVDGEPSNTVYGAYIGADFSYLLTDNLALSLVLKHTYLDNSLLHDFFFYAGIGTSYIIF